MWKVKTKIIPVKTGANGTISKSFRKYLKNIAGKQDIKELQANSHVMHCARTSESSNVTVQDIQYGK